LTLCQFQPLNNENPALNTNDCSETGSFFISTAYWIKKTIVGQKPSAVNILLPSA